MSKAEVAAMLEKQHLKECEESDYQMLEGLFTARASVDDTDDSYEVTNKKIFIAQVSIILVSGESIFFHMLKLCY